MSFETAPSSSQMESFDDTIEGEDEKVGKDEGKGLQEWVNICNRYIVPRTFLENCVVFLERLGNSIVIRTTEAHDEMTLHYAGEQQAIAQFNQLHEMLIQQGISCNIDFGATFE